MAHRLISSCCAGPSLAPRAGPVVARSRARLVCKAAVATPWSRAETVVSLGLPKNALVYGGEVTVTFSGREYAITYDLAQVGQLLQPLRPQHHLWMGG